QRQRPESGDLHPCLPQFIAEALLQLHPPKTVQQQPDLDPGSRPFLECLDELLPDLIGLEDVYLEVDAIPRLLYRVEDGGEEGVAILEQLDLAPLKDWAIKKRRTPFDKTLRAGIRLETNGEIVLRPV